MLCIHEFPRILGNRYLNKQVSNITLPLCPFMGKSVYEVETMNCRYTVFSTRIPFVAHRILVVSLCSFSVLQMQKQKK